MLNKQLDSKQLSDRIASRKTAPKKQNFFFCYDRHLSKELQEIGFKFICSARDTKTDNIFQLFYRTEELNDYLAGVKKCAKSSTIFLWG